MIESALVFDNQGQILHFHLPHGRTGNYIPDSSDLWGVMWKHRKTLGGVAHTHPWAGPSRPSQTDVTTFAACELGLGERLVWPIVTFTHILPYVWVGPGKLDYEIRQGIPPYRVEGINRLRELSSQNGKSTD